MSGQSQSFNSRPNSAAPSDDGKVALPSRVEDNRHDPELEDYVCRVGRACWARAQEGDFREADKLAWRIMHRLEIRAPHQIGYASAQELAKNLPPRAHGTLATAMLQIATSLSHHGHLSFAFDFVERAHVLCYKDIGAWKLVTQLALGDPISDKAKSQTGALVTFEERGRWIGVALTACEKFGGAKFKLVRDDNILMLERSHIQDTDLPLFMEFGIRATRLGVKALDSIPPGPQRIKLVEKSLALSNIVLINFGLTHDPLIAINRESIGVAVPEAHFGSAVSLLASVYSEQSRLFKALGDTARHEAAARMSQCVKS